MNRIEKVLTQIGYTIQNLEGIVQQCPGSYLEGKPRAGLEGCTEDCKNCWESEEE